jgi:hypothetical protein
MDFNNRLLAIESVFGLLIALSAPDDKVQRRRYLNDLREGLLDAENPHRGVTMTDPGYVRAIDALLGEASFHGERLNQKARRPR